MRNNFNVRLWQDKNTVYNTSACAGYLIISILLIDWLQ